MARDTELPFGAAPLTWKGDLAARMVEGLRRYLTRATREAAASRAERWHRDCSSWARHERSVGANRTRLAQVVGVVDPREAPELRTVRVWDELSALTADPFGELDQTVVARAADYQVHEVRWSVLRGVEGEGLLLEPWGCVRANVIALPDADWTPEMLCGLAPGVSPASQYARRLAESGCRVLVPALIDRDDRYSCVAGIMTNQPHREFIYRAAYELGRHIIGYEVQKVLAAVDCLQSCGQPIGVIGYGEGGLLAFYAAALDRRIDATAVSGYFGPREQLFEEPIYRNTWALLREFGDAEIATLIAPRPLVIEACPVPAVEGPPPVRPDRSGAAPGRLTTPSPAAVRREVERARALLDGLEAPIELYATTSAEPGGEGPLGAFARYLGAELADPRGPAAPQGLAPDPAKRLKRQFDQLVEDTQHLMREAEFTRRDYWQKANPRDVKSWVASTRRYRKELWEQVIGAPPVSDLPLNPRARQVYETESFTGYEVALDLYPEVYSYGILLLPKNLEPGERRAVVVCQHGLEGRPQDVADPNLVEPYYKLFACRLAERGFITFAPQNPYIGGDTFRLLQRLGNPLQLSLFSFIIRQHERILQWLKTLPYVDGKRMAFYGLSYGGKTAMRVPAIVEDYCLSICSGDFDEWIWKNCSTRHPYSYMRTGEWEMFEFNLGNTCNYAEMSWLICPRPFMVERGHWDGVAPDEWVAYEYARTRHRYDLLGLQDRTEIEFFNGPHEIHAVGTFEFLERHLRGEGRER